ncbi:hypothetical protein IJT10_04195 [bacterium]|nr:hypothetical protein [bacterium]
MNQMIEKESNDNDYEASFMARISEPIGIGIHLSEEEQDELLKITLTYMLKSDDFTQKELVDLDKDFPKYIEQFGLQHLVSGGWVPLQEDLSPHTQE